MEKGKLLVSDTPEAIQEVMKAKIIEIKCADPKKAVSLVRKMEGVGDVVFFGDKIHVSVRSAKPDETSIEKLLTTEGAGPRSVRTITPSLEDVFFELSGKP
jgi:ABC-type multidrug transport system ATPase subunit